MVFRTWVHGRAPLNLQGPVFKKSGAVGLLILCSKNILELQ